MNLNFNLNLNFNDNFPALMEHAVHYTTLFYLTLPFYLLAEDGSLALRGEEMRRRRSVAGRGGGEGRGGEVQDKTGEERRGTR